MTHDEYASGLGKVVGNFHVLEMALRIFLCEAKQEHIQFPNKGDTTVIESSLTNFRPLSKVIDEYNSLLSNAESQYRVDRRIVTKRDAIAHGRPMTLTELPITLYKFGRPDGSGVVRIEFAETIDDAWLRGTTRQLWDYASAVRECARNRGYKALP